MKSPVLNSLYTFVDQYRPWTGRAATQTLNDYHDEIFQLPPAYSQQWDPRSVEFKGEQLPLIDVFPNPAGSMVNFLVNNPQISENEFFIKIFDAQGREVYSQTLNNSQELFSIDVRNWPSGLYLFQASHQDFVNLSGKFHVQH